MSYRNYHRYKKKMANGGPTTEPTKGDSIKTFPVPVNVDKAYRSITPIGYSPIQAGKEYLAGERLPFTWNGVPTSWETFQEHPMFKENPEKGQYIKDASDAAWKAYIYGMDTKDPEIGNIYSKSKYRPTKAKDKNAKYYSLNNIDDIFDDAISNKLTDKNTKVGTEVNIKDSGAGGFTLSNYKLSKGKDDKGHYISYYDKNDYNIDMGPMSIKGENILGNPFEVYGRIYYDPKTLQIIDDDKVDRVMRNVPAGRMKALGGPLGSISSETWPLIDEVTKNLAKSEENKQFLISMANSPLFGERYKRMSGNPDLTDEEIESYRQDIINNLNTASPIHRSLEHLEQEEAAGYYIPRKKETLRKHIGENVDPKFLKILEEQYDKMYPNRSSHSINLFYTDTDKFSPSTDLHERSHSGTIGSLDLRAKDEPIARFARGEDAHIGNYAEGTFLETPYKELFPNLDENEEEYLSKKTEQKARRDAIAKYLLDRGIYDPVNETFNENHYDALVQDYFKLGMKKDREAVEKAFSEDWGIPQQIGDILRNYNKENAINMFNDFVQNENQEQGLPMAAYGGPIAKYYHGGFPHDPPSEKKKIKKPYTKPLYIKVRDTDGTIRKVEYGTPEYKDYYNSGLSFYDSGTDSYVTSESNLPEVEVTHSIPKPKDSIYSYDYWDKLTPEEKLKVLYPSKAENDLERKHLIEKANYAPRGERGSWMDRGQAALEAMTLGPIAQAGNFFRVPQALMVEGVEQMRGNPYNYEDALDFLNLHNTIDQGVFHTNQRPPSETWLDEDSHWATKLALDLVADPINFVPYAAAGKVPSLASKGIRLPSQLLRNATPSITKGITSGIRSGIGNTSRKLDNLIQLERAYKGAPELKPQQRKVNYTPSDSEPLVEKLDRLYLKQKSQNERNRLALGLESSDQKFDRTLKNIIDKDSPLLTRNLEAAEFADDFSGLKNQNRALGDKNEILGRRTKHFSGAGTGAVWGNPKYNTTFIGNIDDIKSASGSHLRNLQPTDTYFYSSDDVFKLTDKGVYLTSNPETYRKLYAAGKQVKLQPNLFDGSTSKLKGSYFDDRSNILKRFDDYKDKGSMLETTEPGKTFPASFHQSAVHEHDILSHLENLEILPLSSKFMDGSKIGRSLTSGIDDYNFYNQWNKLPKKVRDSELKKIKSFYESNVKTGKLSEYAFDSRYKNNLKQYQKDYKKIINHLEDLHKKAGKGESYDAPPENPFETYTPADDHYSAIKEQAPGVEDLSDVMITKAGVKAEKKFDEFFDKTFDTENKTWEYVVKKGKEKEARAFMEPHYEEALKIGKQTQKWIDDYQKTLNTPEGRKRLIQQELEYLKSIKNDEGFPYKNLTADEEYELATKMAKARWQEVKNIEIKNNYYETYKKQPLEALADNFHDIIKARSTHSAYKKKFVEKGDTYKWNESEGPFKHIKEDIRIGEKSIPGRVSIAVKDNPRPTIAHEVGGHGLQSGRRLPIDDDFLRLIIPKSKGKMTKAQKRSYNYFKHLTDNGKEPSAFGHELRESMLERGIITHRHQKITPAILEEASKSFKNKPLGSFNEETGFYLSSHRILDFMEDSKINYRRLSKLMNRLPQVAAPIAVGAGVIEGTDKKALGGPINPPASQYKRLYGQAKDYGVGTTRGLIDPNTGYKYFPEEGQGDFISNQESVVPENPWNLSRFSFQPFMAGEKQGVHNAIYDSEGNYLGTKELYPEGAKNMRQSMRQGLSLAKDDLSTYYTQDLGLSKKDASSKLRSDVQKLRQMKSAQNKMGSYYFKNFQDPDFIFDESLGYQTKFSPFASKEEVKSEKQGTANPTVVEEMQHKRLSPGKTKRAYTKFQKTWGDVSGKNARKLSRAELKEAKERKEDYIKSMADHYNLSVSDYKKEIKNIQKNKGSMNYNKRLPKKVAGGLVNKGVDAVWGIFGDNESAAADIVSGTLGAVADYFTGNFGGMIEQGGEAWGGVEKATSGDISNIAGMLSSSSEMVGSYMQGDIAGGAAATGETLRDTGNVFGNKDLMKAGDEIDATTEKYQPFINMAGQAYGMFNKGQNTENLELNQPATPLAYGGYLTPMFNMAYGGAPEYEAEGGEVIIGGMPKVYNGGNLKQNSENAFKIEGNSHENGGVDMSGGDYIFSDRIYLDDDILNELDL